MKEVAAWGIQHWGFAHLSHGEGEQLARQQVPVSAFRDKTVAAASTGCVQKGEHWLGKSSNSRGVVSKTHHGVTSALLRPSSDCAA